LPTRFGRSCLGALSSHIQKIWPDCAYIDSAVGGNLL
jgi:hypothetical protein